MHEKSPRPKPTSELLISQGADPTDSVHNLLVDMKLVEGDKRRTIRVQDDQVNDHIDGRHWTYKAYVRGDW